jgi:hypothetical protein
MSRGCSRRAYAGVGAGALWVEVLEESLRSTLAEPLSCPTHKLAAGMQVRVKKTRRSERHPRDLQKNLGAPPFSASRPELVWVNGRNRARTPSLSRRWRDGSFSLRPPKSAPLLQIPHHALVQMPAAPPLPRLIPTAAVLPWGPRVRSPPLEVRPLLPSEPPQNRLRRRLSAALHKVCRRSRPSPLSVAMRCLTSALILPFADVVEQMRPLLD